MFDKTAFFFCVGYCLINVWIWNNVLLIWSLKACQMTPLTYNLMIHHFNGHFNKANWSFMFFNLNWNCNCSLPLEVAEDLAVRRRLRSPFRRLRWRGRWRPWRPSRPDRGLCCEPNLPPRRSGPATRRKTSPRVCEGNVFGNFPFRQDWNWKDRLLLATGSFPDNNKQIWLFRMGMRKNKQQNNNRNKKSETLFLFFSNKRRWEERCVWGAGRDWKS